MDQRRTRVTGVRVRSSRGADRLCASDLVIDASGRGSRSPEWLTGLGYDAPKMDTVHVDIGYTTRTYRRRPGDLDGALAATHRARTAASNPHGLHPADGERSLDRLARRPAGRLRAHRCGRIPRICAAPCRGRTSTTSSSPPSRSPKPCPSGFPRTSVAATSGSPAFPQRYLVMGDALCSFNPIYGQGMSVAALEAMALADALNSAHALEDLSHRFFPKAAAIVATPWTIAAGSDFAFPGVTGTRPLGTGVVNWYPRPRPQGGVTWDRVVCRAFFDVGNLRKAPTSLFRPSIVARVAAGAWAGRAMRPYGDRCQPVQSPGSTTVTQRVTRPVMNRSGHVGGRRDGEATGGLACSTRAESTVRPASRASSPESPSPTTSPQYPSRRPMASGVASPRVLTIDDLRELARRRLPRMVFDYIDGGAEDEITLADNCRAFDTITFRPRGAVELASCRSSDHGARSLARTAVSPRAARQQPDVLSSR